MEIGLPGAQLIEVVQKWCAGHKLKESHRTSLRQKTEVLDLPGLPCFAKLWTATQKKSVPQIVIEKFTNSRPYTPYRKITSRAGR
jgi:hypothetical protein